MSDDVELGTVETKVPARLDRLPWAGFHKRVILGLGTVWILDGLEVTIVGSVAARLAEKGSGINLDAGQIGTAAAIYVAGACLGALFFGHLTDRLGRKKLFMMTLGVYILATVATAFSFAPWYFYIARFVTGAGIGGEYAAINSAIDELIPARVRGRVDLGINGSYWLGSAAGAAAALFFLDTAIFPADIGWRLAFGLGAVLGLTIMLVRRHVPESPRWLFIHGREEEAERIVSEIEEGVEEETGQELSEPDSSIEVRQRKTIPFREIAGVAFKLYPKRAILGLSLFIGQAFIYNGVTFNLGTLFSTFFGVAAGAVPIFIIIYAIGNFLGPLTLGRLFDTVGRKTMIAGTYIGSAAVAVVLGILFTSGVLSEYTFIALVVVTFFLASAGASAAYLTVSEIFPMETRALAIAFFYAVGTAVGGISGPLLFGHLIESGDRGEVALAFYIGAAVMAIGGVIEVLFGVKAEQQELEDIATPLTVEEAEEDGEHGEDGEPAADASPEHRAALAARERAEEERARAAAHRSAIHELRARETDGDERAADRAEVEEQLAEIGELRAQSLEEQATAHDERAAAEDVGEDADRDAGFERARAAELRARALDERAAALAAEYEADSDQHAALAEAAGERARASEHRALAESARGDADAADGAHAELAAAQAEMHDRWSRMHEELGRGHERRAESDQEAADEHRREGKRLEELALAAEELVTAAEHAAAAEEIQQEQEDAEGAEQRRAAAAEREREAHERSERIRGRVERRRQHGRRGLRRFKPGPGSAAAPQGMVVSSGASAEGDLDREIDVIARALSEHGPTQRGELANLVGARYWGPGRFRAAIREAVDEGRARRLSRTTLGPPEAESAET
jgi:MFS family permease